MNTPSSKSSPLPITREQALALSVPDKLAFFQGIRLNHPRVNQLLKGLEIMALPGSGTDIALLIGPTGVGKSTLVDGLRARIYQSYQQELGEDPSFIPVVVTEAPSSGERGFAWRMFYLRLGEALYEPLMDKKQETALRDGRVVVRHVASGTTVTALRVAIEKVLRARKTSLVIIDEAVHLLRNLNGNTLANHMDALKSLANICGVTLAMVGSYDLLQVLDLSGQVARRSAIVHFQRYLTGVPEDELAFRKTLQMLQRQMPVEGMSDLARYSLNLQEACVGCIGILKDTLSRALGMALLDGGRWSEGCLEKALLAPHQTRSILDETLQGEARMRSKNFGSGSFQASAKEFKEAECMSRGAA